MKRLCVVGLVVAALSGAVFAQSPGIREVKLSPRTVVTVNAKVGFTTMIVMPPSEPLADVIWGDTVGWSVDETGNILRVTPLKAGAESNLNVVMPDSTVYTFILREGAKDGGKALQPDFQIVGKTDAAAAAGKRQFIPLETHEAELEAMRAETASMKEAVTKATELADQRVAEFRSTYPLTVRRYESQPLRVAPFFVQNVWADDEFTWIQIKATELPAVYEVLDGKPAILNPVAIPGKVTTFKIPKIVTDGYLEAGKAKWRFQASQ
jgi:type IV secretory pathway VirB9-like protein